MSKCHVRELMHVLDNIWRDMVNTYPTLVGEFVKDKSRLRSFVECRGIYALCVDMVAAGKHFDRCFSNGEYKLSGLPLTKRFSNRVVIPKFLRGLYLLVFDEGGTLKGDYDVQAIVFLRQILFVGKKASLPCSEGNVRKEVSEFALVDLELPIPERFWAEPSPRFEDVEECFSGFQKSPLYIGRIADEACALKRARLTTFLMNLDKISKFITATLGPYRFSEWRFRHGPGAVSERSGSEFNKYSWTNWSDRLESAFPIADCGFHNYGSWADTAFESRVGSRDPSSRLISVPKTFTRPRLIAAEPSENQWCQQNIWHYFSRRSQDSWIGNSLLFRDQRRNQDLCVRGSRTGSHATVDLSAASDRVSCHLVGQYFAANPPLVLALQASRTRFLEQDINPLVDAKLELRKFSTMGSACTFPVQSLIFLGICLASVVTKRQLQAGPKNIKFLAEDVAVFGDDLIIPSDSRELLFEALELLQFKVNVHKSYWTGLFRESCGVDAVGGVNVTPAYWRSPNNGDPESIASTVEVANNFERRFLVHTARYLASTIPDGVIPKVSMDSGVCGLKSFARPDLPPIKRWNPDLQRIEARVGLLVSKQRRTPITDDSALLQYFTESPSPSTQWKSGVPQRPKSLRRFGWVPLDDIII